MATTMTIAQRLDYRDSLFIGLIRLSWSNLYNKTNVANSGSLVLCVAALLETNITRFYD